MANLETFRKKVRRYYRTRYHQDGKTKYTQGDLAALIPINEDELGKRLNGYRDEKTGRVWQLTEENVLDIVLRLAELKALTWEQAVELLVLMDYPVKANHLSWQAKLREHLDPPDQVRSPISKTANGTNTAQGNRLDLPRRLFQARDLPKSYVPRPTVFNHIKQLLLNRESQRPTAIALRGAGGFGKTTLANALCHDPEIQEAFSDGILWRELGEHPPGPLTVLNELLHVLEPSEREALTLEEARKRWQNVLTERSYLLVIDDVWHMADMEELLQGGPRCGRLITTRNDQLLPEEANKVWVDAMEPEEAMTLLCQGVIDDWQHALDPSVLEQVVVQQLGCWPLLVSLARGMLNNQVGRLHKAPTQALALLKQAYEDRGMATFHLGDRIERQRNVDACMEVNLRQLEEWVPAHYQVRQHYLELAVFPEDTDIPLSTLQIYWKGTGGLHEYEVEELCLHLSDLSLLLPRDTEPSTIRVHDVLRSYLIQRAGNQLSTLHRRLLDAHQQHYHLTRWADIPQSEAYLWHHLIFHLHQAGRQEVLQATLSDLHYLIYKVLYVGVSELEADLVVSISELEADLAVSISELKTNLALASPQSFAQESFPPMAELYRYIARFGYLLFQVHTFAEVGEIFLNHLPKELATDDQRRVLQGEYDRPFLAPWYPLPNRVSSLSRVNEIRYFGWARSCAVSSDGRLIVSAYDNGYLKMWNAASGAELLTLATLGVGWVCAVSPNSRFIVSGSWDGTLKVWDAASGTERFTLTGHTHEVNACAVSPDGCFIVSASYDCTLKVWDAASGAELLTLAGHINAVTGCAVSADGRYIVSTSWDNTIKLWDATSGRCLFTLPGEDGLYGCVFHPDGEHLVICGALGMYFLRLVS